MRHLFYIVFVAVSLNFTPTSNNQKSPKDFNGDIEKWANWLDENDTNVGLIDTVYDFNFIQLSFKNKIVLRGGGTIENTFPIAIRKGLDIENVSFKNSKKWSQYGYVFYGYDLDSVSVRLVNVKSKRNMKFLHIDARKANVFIDNNIHEENLKGAIFIKAIIHGAIFKNNIIRNSLPTKRYAGVIIGNAASKDALISDNRFENNKTGIYGKLFYNLLVVGDSTVLMNNKFLECQVGYYIRGNNAIEYKNTVFNDSVPASYMFINKGARTKGTTIRFENEYIGKAFRVGLFDGIDDQYNYKNTFDIIPTDVVIDGVKKRSKGALRESSTYRKAQNVNFYLIDNSIKITTDKPYDFLSLRFNKTHKNYIQKELSKKYLYLREIE